MELTTTEKNLLQYFCTGMNKLINTTYPTEWTSENRVLIPGQGPHPGAWNWSRTPYIKEPLNCMHKQNNVRYIAIRKSAQVGFTTGFIQNAIGWVIQENPQPMLYIGATENLAKTITNKSIEAMCVNNPELKKLIGKSIHIQDSQRSGNTQTLKEFPGGYLRALGPSSSRQLVSESYAIVFLDELDRYEQELKQAGDTIKFIEARTLAYAETKKIILMGTPSKYGSSSIDVQFNRGDKRQYNVPCPICDQYSVWQWDMIRYKTDSYNKLIQNSVYLECPHCKGHINNSMKFSAIEKGKWIATTTGENNFRSYEMSSIISNFISWDLIVEEEYLPALEDTSKMQSFYNNILGLSYAEKTETPTYSLVRELEADYKKGFIPKQVQLITYGIDIQQNRIEIEMLGHGKLHRNYSIEYYIIHGDTANEGSSVWNDLTDILQQKIIRSDGLEIPKNQVRACIDAGYMTQIVYNYAKQYGVLPVMGRQNIHNFKYKEVIIHDGISNEQKNIISARNNRNIRLDICNYKYNTEIYSNLKNPHPKQNSNKTGICYFPKGYSDDYYKQLTSEHLVEKRVGSKRIFEWKLYGTKNEALDCRKYALASRDYTIDILMKAHNIKDKSTIYKILEGFIGLHNKN